MFERVDDYLDKLREELSGADPATLHDALADAEDHLRTGQGQLLKANPELSPSDALAQVIEAYGDPVEVAAAYRQIAVAIHAHALAAASECATGLGLKRTDQLAHLFFDLYHKFIMGYRIKVAFQVDINNPVIAGFE